MAVSYGISAIGLTFAVLSIFWQRKGYAALVESGQWLLLRHAIGAIRFYISVIPFAIAHSYGWGTTSSFLRIVESVRCTLFRTFPGGRNCAAAGFVCMVFVEDRRHGAMANCLFASCNRTSDIKPV